MRNETSHFEADKCRRHAATTFHDRPEKAFLLRLADEFDELGREPERLRDRHP